PRPPAGLRASRAAELPRDPAGYLAIYGEGVGDALAPLIARRKQQGLTSAAVDVQILDDAFNFGEHGPAALQRYLAQLDPRPSQVLLVGRANLDPHDYLATGMPDLLP